MRAARVDENQSQIAKDLRARGMSVAITSGIGDGFPDLVVGIRGRNYLFEVKRNHGAPSTRKKTVAQYKFHGDWRGQISLIESAEDALYVIFASEDFDATIEDFKRHYRASGLMRKTLR